MMQLDKVRVRRWMIAGLAVGLPVMAIAILPFPAVVAPNVYDYASYLFLDEPYANLDDDAAALVSRAVAGWNSADRIAVVATHGAKRVKPYAVAGVILRDGRVVTEGTYAGAER